MSPLSALRSRINEYFPPPPDLSTPPTLDSSGCFAVFGGGLKTWFLDDGSVRQVLSAKSPFTSRGRESAANPPLHFHMWQAEIFEVIKGTMVYVEEGVEKRLMAGEKGVIRPGDAHTFWVDASTGEDLEVVVTTTPKHLGFDHDFILNFYSYMDRTIGRGTTPSTIQLLTFLDGANVCLADPPRPIGRAMNLVLGRFVGQYIAGYKPRYPEWSTGLDIPLKKRSDFGLPPLQEGTR